MPVPLSAEVTWISGKGRRALGHAPWRVGSGHLLKLGGLDLVDLGQDHLVGDGGFVQQLEHLAVVGLDAMAAVDQHEGAGQTGTAAQVARSTACHCLTSCLEALA